MANKRKPKPLTAGQVLDAWMALSQQGIVRSGKPLVVFGATPGLVTEVTVGAGGNLTLVYMELPPEG